MVKPAIAAEKPNDTPAAASEAPIPTAPAALGALPTGADDLAVLIPMAFTAVNITSLLRGKLPREKELEDLR
jgi:hypothetical protein